MRDLFITDETERLVKQIFAEKKPKKTFMFVYMLKSLAKQRSSFLMIAVGESGVDTKAKSTNTGKQSAYDAKIHFSC